MRRYVRSRADQTKNALISMLALRHSLRYYADIRSFWRVGHGAIDRAGFAGGVGVGAEAPGSQAESQCRAGASRNIKGGSHGNEAAAVGGCIGGDSERG